MVPLSTTYRDSQWAPTSRILAHLHVLLRHSDVVNSGTVSAFCRHSNMNTRCQSDAQQFWRQDLCRCRTTSLEQSAAQYQTMWAVIWPVQAVTEDIHYLDSEATAQCELF